MTTSTGSKYYPAIQFRLARPTSRLQEVVRFYTEGLQLKVLSSFEAHAGYSGVMIGLPDVYYHFEFTQDEKATICQAPTKDNLLVLYFPTIEDLNQIRTSLKNLGRMPVSLRIPIGSATAGLMKIRMAGGWYYIMERFCFDGNAANKCSLHSSLKEANRHHFSFHLFVLPFG